MEKTGLTKSLSYMCTMVRKVYNQHQSIRKRSRVAIPQTTVEEATSLGRLSSYSLFRNEKLRLFVADKKKERLLASCASQRNGLHFWRAVGKARQGEINSFWALVTQIHVISLETFLGFVGTVIIGFAKPLETLKLILR